MSKICGYSCEHNKSGVCQISGCDKKSIILDYTIVPNSDIKPLLDKLEKENKILRENAENNDKVVDKVNWENMLLKKENQELKDKIPYIIQNNSCKYISIEKCKNKVCVNYKIQELEKGCD